MFKVMEFARKSKGGGQEDRRAETRGGGREVGGRGEGGLGALKRHRVPLREHAYLD